MILLQDSLETKKRGKPVYFGGMSQIGPMYTEITDCAEKFRDRREAQSSPAYHHPLCFFEPVEVIEKHQNSD